MSKIPDEPDAVVVEEVIFKGVTYRVTLNYEQGSCMVASACCATLVCMPYYEVWVVSVVALGSLRMDAYMRYIPQEERPVIDAHARYAAEKMAKQAVERRLNTIKPGLPLCPAHW